MPDFESNIMDQVTGGQISMRPKWYFVLGSIASFLGMVGISVGIIFLLHISIFLVRSHGPMSAFRLETMVRNFPVWIPLAALGLTIAGIFLLKRYDFSYRTNFWAVVSGFLASLLIASILIDITGIGDAWVRRGPMRRYFQEKQEQLYRQDSFDVPRGNGKGEGWFRKKFQE